MDNTFIKKAKLNAFSGYVNLLLNSIILILINPLLLRFLGDFNFGIWKSIQKILSFASVADGRSTQALKWIIANSESETDISKKKRAVGSAFKVSLYFIPLTLIIVVLLIWNLPFLINDIPAKYFNEIRIVGFILGLNILLSPLLSIPDSILVGSNKGYMSMKIQTITMVLSNVLFLVVAYLGYGLLGLSIVTFLIVILNSILIFLVCKSNVKWFGYESPKKEDVKVFFNFSFWVFIWSFIERLLLSTEIILISYLINPEEVTIYSFSSYIVQLVIPIVLLTGSAVTPGLGKIIGDNDLISSKRIVVLMRSVINSISILFGCFIIIFNKMFIEIWVGENYYAGNLCNFLLVLIMVQLVSFRNDSQIQDLTLSIKLKVVYGLIFSVLSIVLGVVLFKIHPTVESILIGILLGRLFLNLVYKKLVNDYFKIELNLAPELLIFILLTLCYLLYDNVLFVLNYFYLLIVGTAIMVVSSLLVYGFILDDSVKIRIKSIFQRPYGKR